MDIDHGFDTYKVKVAYCTVDVAPPGKRRPAPTAAERGESFDGPPSSAIFAGGGFIYIAPDYLGLGDSTVRTLPGFDHVNSWVQAMPRAARHFRTLD